MCSLVKMQQNDLCQWLVLRAVYKNSVSTVSTVKFTFYVFLRSLLRVTSFPLGTQPRMTLGALSKEEFR